MEGTDDTRNVVMVPGGFMDGSSWMPVYHLLKADGYAVSVVQTPTVCLEEDAAAARRVLDRQDGPTVLVGHSYGGVVITEAGTHPCVAALVYVAAFAPDMGESVRTLTADPLSRTSTPPLLPPVDGYLVLDRGAFHAAFAADLPADQAAFLADAQVPCGVDTLGGTVFEPAWRSRPSWYLVATDDRMIPAPMQRAMSERAGSTVVEVPGSHAVHLSRPDAVVELIRKAAAGR